MAFKIPFLSASEPLPQGLSRPTWIVLDLAGPYPERQPAHFWQGLLNRTETLEALEEKVARLQQADWLHGVLLRFGQLEISPAKAHALRNILARLAQHKRLVAYVPQLNMLSALVASAAPEVVAPEAAEVSLSGFGLEQTFLGAFLNKQGIEFENLRIKEYKAALTRFSQAHMDEANREQLGAYLAGLEAAWVRELAAARGVAEERARGWLDADLNSAQAAYEAGLISKVAYEDELIGPGSRPLAAVLDLLMPKKGHTAKAGRIAVVPVVGTIITGKSKHNPLPLPIFGGPMAGSDTVVAALKRAKQDPHTKAIVVYVNSGGGSALASDLMQREIAKSEKPVVVVMGDYAASGGYYLATHAKRIIASPYTLTGSIGVVTGKPVLKGFNERHGFNPEGVGREGALKYSASRPFSDHERQSVERSIAEVYDRFTQRVADGRRLSQEQVNELGRGRIWVAQDALERGLVDELGDLHTGLRRAAELAGLSYDASTWNVTPKSHGPFPEFVRPAAELMQWMIWPFGRERVLTWLDQDIRVR